MVAYFIIFSFIWVQAHTGCIESERKALVDIKTSLIDESRCLASWVGYDCCSWLGVICNKTNGHVVELRLDPYFLGCDDETNGTAVFRGEINPSLSNLTYLSYFYLTKCKINGSIPASIWQLSMLEVLFLYNNAFSGVISELHFAKLKSLKQLFLVDNMLLALNVSSTWVPPFQLETLGLGSMRLGPKFPPWLQTQSRLTTLNLANTSISDSIPGWFVDTLSTIIELDLSHNELRGKVPEFPETMTSIILSFNKFESMPKCFFSNFASIDLSNNLLQGHLSASCSYGRMVSLQLSNNSLSGPIPESLCTLPFIVFDLSTNHFSGEIPICFGNLTSLISLDLSNNNLHGQIPTLSDSLLSIYLSNNFFHGKLPYPLQNSTSLEILDLGRNEINDILPPWLGKLKSLRILNLESNSFHGEIPQDLCMLGKLQILSLARNNLSGRIPPCLNNFTAMAVNTGESFYNTPEMLFTVDVYIDATIKGIERHYTSNSRYLVSLDLSDNNLVGEIPKGVGDLVVLLNLNLSSNLLEGHIPQEIGGLNKLESLDLSRNKLYGPVPLSLSNLNFLSRLNLSYNELTGRIPTGNQLQTLDDPSSIYVGNSGVCGESILKSCPGDKIKSSDEVTNQEEDDSDGLWFYIGMGPGFFTGFVGFFGVLYFKQTWRHRFFLFFDNCYDWLVVAVVVKAAVFRRKFHKDSH